MTAVRLRGMSSCLLLHIHSCLCLFANLEAESDSVEVDVSGVVQVAEALTVRIHADILPLQQRALNILPPAKCQLYIDFTLTPMNVSRAFAKFEVVQSSPGL